MSRLNFLTRPRRRRDYRTTLEVQKRTAADGSTAADAFGHTQTTWSTVGTIRAYVSQMSGDEAVIAHARWPRATHAIETDYNGKINTNTRLKVPSSSRWFGIEQLIDLEERGRTFRIIAREEVST
jgi:SPP1 family predicted phage head-tail adaptor